MRLRYATADGTATAPGDYTPVPPTELVIAPLATAVTTPVDVLGDTDPEANETFRVELSGVENATVSDGEAIGTIIDDEPAATLSIDDVTVVEGDAGTRAAAFTVTRSHTAGDVSFRFLTEDGSATPLADYFPNGGTVTFATGSPTATFAVDVAGDVLDEDDETFGVRLSTPVDAVIADGFALGTIADDDAAPAFSIDDVSVQEGNAGTTVARFTITLSAVEREDGDCRWPRPPTARQPPPGDYTAVAPTTLTFAGTTTRTFDVTINGDGDPDSTETFSVELSGAVNATVADGQGVGTILDDEAPANDDFADAAPLGEGATPFDTSFATIETDEPGLDPNVPVLYPTVWFRFSPGRGAVELRAPRLSVYTGTSLGALTLVARSDGTGGIVPIQFPSVEGQEYLVQLLGPSAFFGAGIGRATLDMTFNPAPANDDFDDAAPLATGTTPLDTSFATIQASEPGLASLDASTVSVRLVQAGARARRRRAERQDPPRRCDAAAVGVHRLEPRRAHARRTRRAPILSHRGRPWRRRNRIHGRSRPGVSRAGGRRLGIRVGRHHRRAWLHREFRAGHAGHGLPSGATERRLRRGDASRRGHGGLRHLVRERRTRRARSCDGRARSAPSVCLVPAQPRPRWGQPATVGPAARAEATLGLHRRQPRRPDARQTSRLQVWLPRDGRRDRRLPDRSRSGLLRASPFGVDIPDRQPGSRPRDPEHGLQPVTGERRLRQRGPDQRRPDGVRHLLRHNRIR